MSWIQRVLGLGTDGATAGEGGARTATVRRIAAELERLPPGRASWIAGLACVLARIAHVDLVLEDAERDEMTRIVREQGELSEAETGLAVEMALVGSAERGGTESFLVTRKLREAIAPEQRARLVDCAFAVAAADGSISTPESEEVIKVAEELGFSRKQALGMRARWRDRLAELQGLRSS